MVKTRMIINVYMSRVICRNIPIYLSIYLSIYQYLTSENNFILLHEDIRISNPSLTNLIYSDFFCIFYKPKCKISI